MGTEFFARRAPANPADRDGWVLGQVRVGCTMTSAGHLLTLLGLDPGYDSSPEGELPPGDMAHRINVAWVEGITVARERWPGYRPGYWPDRLAELRTVVAEAEAIGGLVAWS